MSAGTGDSLTLETQDIWNQNESKWSAWVNYKETPPALVAHLRLSGDSNRVAT